MSLLDDSGGGDYGRWEATAETSSRPTTSSSASTITFTAPTLSRGGGTHSSAFSTLPNTGDVPSKYEVVVGTIVSPPPSPPRSHGEDEGLYYDRHDVDDDEVSVTHSTSTGGAPAVAAAGTSYYYHYYGSYNDDRIPSKPLRRSSSESEKSRTKKQWEGAGTSAPSAAGAHMMMTRPHPSNRSGFPISSKFNVTSSSTSHPVIEVAPGLEMRLRGSQETWEAIARDFYVPVLCWGCSESIFVIQDAAFVVCPTCRTISPADGTFEHPEMAGVGLGFTFEELQLWQDQINSRRNHRNA